MLKAERIAILVIAVVGRVVIDPGHPGENLLGGGAQISDATVGVATFIVGVDHPSDADTRRCRSRERGVFDLIGILPGVVVLEVHRVCDRPRIDHDCLIQTSQPATTIVSGCNDPSICQLRSSEPPLVVEGPGIASAFGASELASRGIEH